MLKKDSIIEVFNKLNNNPDIILKTTILPSIIKGNAFYKDNVISININAVNNMKEVYNIISHELTHCNVYNNSINNTGNYYDLICLIENLVFEDLKENLNIKKYYKTYKSAYNSSYNELYARMNANKIVNKYFNNENIVFENKYQMLLDNLNTYIDINNNQIYYYPLFLYNYLNCIINKELIKKYSILKNIYDENMNIRSLEYYSNNSNEMNDRLAYQFIILGYYDSLSNKDYATKLFNNNKEKIYNFIKNIDDLKSLITNPKIIKNSLEMNINELNLINDIIVDNNLDTNKVYLITK
ncbi:MAG: hypothetical protein SOZ95_05420 [Bacilli bacterium]|nr:hypothetical protein [Bacilli bacterium]